MEILQLKIYLLGIEPQIHRTIQVPATITLRNLHRIIQRVMEWQEYHLYQFVKDERSFGPKSKVFDMPEVKNDKSVPVIELLAKPRHKMFYEYDFGDGWLHEILLQKILPTEEGVRYPVCIDGKHAGPPEDSGGPPGYCDLLVALDDPEHEGHDDAKGWLGADYDPASFDLETINRRLRRIKV
jgi:hypothetical protein